MLWRKGFFRVWVFFSALWFVTVAVFSYSGISDPFIGKRAFVFSEIDIEASERIAPIPTEILHSKRIYSVSFNSGAYDYLRRQKAENKLVEIEVQGLTEFSFFVPSGLDDVAMASKAKEVLQPMRTTKDPLISERRRERLLEGLAAALVPSIVLLILGIAIGWVSAGFRKSV